jgi:hypothetical protein
MLEEVNFSSLSMGVVCVIGGVWHKKVAEGVAVSLEDGKLLLDGSAVLVSRHGIPVRLEESKCLICRDSLRRRPEVQFS